MTDQEQQKWANTLMLFQTKITILNFAMLSGIFVGMSALAGDVVKDADAVAKEVRGMEKTLKKFGEEVGIKTEKDCPGYEPSDWMMGCGEWGDSLEAQNATGR